MRTAILALMLLPFAALGMVLLIWAEQIRSYAIRYRDEHPNLDRIDPFGAYVRGGYYTQSLRIMGAVAVLACAFAIAASLFCSGRTWLPGNQDKTTTDNRQLIRRQIHVHGQNPDDSARRC